MCFHMFIYIWHTIWLAQTVMFVQCYIWQYIVQQMYIIYGH